MIDLQDNGEEPAPAAQAGHVWFQLEDGFRETVCQAHCLHYTASPASIILTAAQGSGSIIIDGLLYPLAGNTVYFVQPGQRVETVRDEAQEELLLYQLQFRLYPSGTSGEPFAAELQAGWSTVSTELEALVQSLCAKIVSHWHTSDPADRFVSQSAFQYLLHLLFKQQGKHEAGLEQAFYYMKQHYRESVTVETLADMAGMSRYYFMRSFKERYGQSVMDCLGELRTNEAKRLLEAGRSLQDVAEQAGYKDTLYFSSQFKKQVGIPPRSYSANRRFRTAAYSWPNIGHLLTLQTIPYAAPIDQSWTDDYRRKYRYDVKVPLSHDYEFNLKALSHARPDRILALDEMIPEVEKEKLRQIAPVLFLRWHQDNWRTHLQQTAAFLDLAKDAERWLTRYDRKAEAVRQMTPAAFRQGRLLVLNISPRGIQIWGRRAGTVLYDDLQIRWAGGVEQIRFTEYVEAEQLAAFDAEVMLVSVTKERQSRIGWERLQQSECWKRLKVVRNGKIYVISGHNWLSEPILEYTANRQESLLQELELLFRAL